jgi:hypothetical protein
MQEQVENFPKSSKGIVTVGEEHPAKVPSCVDLHSCIGRWYDMTCGQRWLGEAGYENEEPKYFSTAGIREQRLALSAGIAVGAQKQCRKRALVFQSYSVAQDGRLQTETREAKKKACWRETRVMIWLEAVGSWSGLGSASPSMARWYA